MSRPNTLSTRIEEFQGKYAGLTRNAKECCMYRVHEQLRDVSEKAYKPVLLAIGPYNDQGKVGQGFMEEHKLHYLQQMLKRTKGSVETYIATLKELEEKARKCYGEHISQTSNDQFVEMMVLDGCFIIELFHRYEIYKETGDCQDDPIFQMKWVLPRIARDLLLFENQLPFFLLAKLFGMSESNNTQLRLSRSKNLGEHVVDIDEEKDGIINVENSTSTAQIIQTRLNDLALNFFSSFLPFRWNVDASSYNSTEKIKHLLCLAHEALTPSLLDMVCQRLAIGFRFKNAKFEHLLGLIHATIGISLLDTEIDHARERQEARVKLKNAEIFKRLFGLLREAIIPLLAKMENIRKAISYTSKFHNPGFKVNKPEIEDWESIPCGSMFQDAGVEFNMAKKVKDDLLEILNWTTIPYAIELQEAEIEFNMAKKFKDDLFEIECWMTIPCAIELQEAGIEFDKAKKFKDLHDRNRNEDQKLKLCETGTQMVGFKLKTVEKFKHLLCLDKIKNWKSIPYGKELRESGVEFNKAKKFKRLLALREIEDWNIHGATELAEAGIKFKKADKCDMFSIKFNKGLMEISPLSITDDTETYLRNLIAYEQYCDRDNGFNYVTNYVCFMDDLINTLKDVELLRRRGIIQNYLGDDEVISTMVNKLGDNIIISTSRSIYARTSMEVNMHCRRRRNVWMAKLRRNYFNSPWALLSFLAAVLLIALAITQTLFSIIH